MAHQKRKRKPPISLLELTLVISIMAVATLTILPSVRLTREAIAIERAAQCLEKSEAVIAFILTNDATLTNRLDISLEMIANAFGNTNLSAHISPIVWPAEAVLSSFNSGENGNPTINVRLKSGETTVSIDDISSPRTSRQETAPPAVSSFL